VCRSVIISVHTCGAESLTKNLSMSAPRLTGRPRVEALVACGAHQIQTQGKCTREVGGRESGRGRERERACVPVPLSCGGRACTILLQEGGGAQSCSQRRHVNEYGPIAAHTGCTIAGLPRFLTVSRRTFARKAHGGRSFPGPSAYCVVHCCLVLQSELGVANFQIAASTAVCLQAWTRNLHQHRAPAAGRVSDPSTEVQTPARKQRRVQPRCPRPDQLSPASSAHRGGRAAPSPLLWASARFRRRARKRVTGMARPCAHNAERPHLHPVPVRAQHGTPAPATVQPWSRWPGSR